MKNKETISMEVFDMAMKQAISHAELHSRQELEDQLFFYKRLCRILIIVLSMIALCSVLLNIKLMSESKAPLPGGIWTYKGY
ncbi:hypothetical protein ACDQ55_15890 [Chitinophaga sp. 30R24]|uniref:hypothetical protein n=1 Tax=Chitinophaga sp. 30R24 TaxID=3248838 RepID=UPI003B9157BA